MARLFYVEIIHVVHDTCELCQLSAAILYSNRRPTWNIKDNLGHKVKVMPYPQATAELEKIHAIAVEDKAMMHERFKQPESERSIDEVRYHPRFCRC